MSSLFKRETSPPPKHTLYIYFCVFPYQSFGPLKSKILKCIEIPINGRMCMHLVMNYKLVEGEIYRYVNFSVRIFMLLNKYREISFSNLTCILNAISNAPHNLLMTAEANESQFPKFSFQFIWHWSHNNTFKRKLFCRIPVFYNSLGLE